jgi:hypothetical protein
LTKEEALKLALEALELALSSHGVVLLSDPPQDSWKTRGVESKSRQAITAIKEALAQPAQEEKCKHQFQVDQDAPKHKCCQICGLVVGSSAQPAQEPIPYSGADESPPVFGRRWKLAIDGFGLQRDDVNGNYVHIDDALSVLHQSSAQPAQEPDELAIAYMSGLHDGKKQRPWVGLDEQDFSAINQSCLTKLQAATSAESILKEKNNAI